jgi:hypothetical protein
MSRLFICTKIEALDRLKDITYFDPDLYKLPIELNLSKHLNNFQKNLAQESTISPWLHRELEF